MIRTKSIHGTKMKIKSGWILFIITITALVCFPLSANAAEMDKKSDTSAEMSDAEETINGAIRIFSESGQDPAASIPADVLENAAGIAVFPETISAALVAGGMHGSGVIMARQEDGEWSPPLFVSLSGGSVGAQVGVEKSDNILVFRNREVLEKVAQGGDFTLGADASVMAGETGGKASTSTKDAQILTYQRNTSGLFAGVSLEGSVMNIQEEPTIAYYGLGEQQGEEAGARGYYEDEKGLFNHIIGEKDGMGGQAAAIEKMPESTDKLHQALNDYISREKERMQQ